MPPGSRPGGGSSCAPLHTGTRAWMRAVWATPSVRGEHGGACVDAHSNLKEGKRLIRCARCRCRADGHPPPWLPVFLLYSPHETPHPPAANTRPERTHVHAHARPPPDLREQPAERRAQSGTCPPSLASHDPKTLQHAPHHLTRRCHVSAGAQLCQSTSHTLLGADYADSSSRPPGGRVRLVATITLVHQQK